MKNCEKCDKKVKNGFKLCYSCNETKSETSEPETPVAYAFRASPSPSPPSYRFQCSPAMASCDGLYAQ